MYKYGKRAKSRKELGGGKYVEMEFFPNGRLPVEKTVIETMMYVLRPERAGRTSINKSLASRMLAYVLIEHWNFCNIYTITVRKIHFTLLTK